MSELAVRSLGIRTLSALLGAGALVGLAGGCLFTNTSHCGYKADGADNPCPDGFVCNVCAAANNGCVPFDQRNTISDSCLDSGGGTTSDPLTSTSEPTLTATTSLPPTSTTTETSITSTTEPTSTTVSVTTTDTDPTDPTDPTVSPNCDPAVSVEDPGCAPLYCVAPGQCGPCSEFPGEVTCAALNPDLPLCDPDSGKCSECTADDVSACPANAPICDAGLCSPCTEHSQCPGEACDIEEGVCFPDDAESVFFVKGDNVNCGGNGKTPETAFCTLAAVPLTAPKTTIRMLINSKPPGQLVVNDGVVALIAHQVQRPEISGQNKLNPTIDVAGAGARLYLSKIKFRFAPTAPAIIRCNNDGTLYVHDVTIGGNTMEEPHAIGATDCKVRIHRTDIVKNGAGIQVSGGDLEVVNSYILENGNNGKFGAFNFINNPKARITYSTILKNSVSTFSCLGPAPDQPAIELRNSAVLGIGLASNTCGVGVNMGKVAVNHGVVQSEVDETGFNATLGMWFQPPMQNVYTPAKTGPLKDAAQWGSGDPRKDYVGYAIPKDDPSFAGAKQYPE